MDLPCTHPEHADYAGKPWATGMWRPCWLWHNHPNLNGSVALATRAGLELRDDLRVLTASEKVQRKEALDRRIEQAKKEAAALRSCPRHGETVREEKRAVTRPCESCAGKSGGVLARQVVFRCTHPARPMGGEVILADCVKCPYRPGADTTAGRSQPG
jgi:hypothetical protein